MKLISLLNYVLLLSAGVGSPIYAAGGTGCLGLILLSEFQINAGLIHLHRLFGALATHRLEADEFTCM